MFDIGASELLLTVIVAIVVIGPKDLPRALRMAGSWLAKIRKVSGHFRSGIEEMIRQAELDDMEKKWREKNAAIMQQEASAEPGSEAGPQYASGHEPEWANHALPSPDAGDPYGQITQPAESEPAGPAHEAAPADLASPELPLTRPKGQP
jgi:sec-independent protein translocase protein TatB